MDWLIYSFLSYPLREGVGCRFVKDFFLNHKIFIGSVRCAKQLVSRRQRAWHPGPAHSFAEILTRKTFRWQVSPSADLRRATVSYCERMCSVYWLLSKRLPRNSMIKLKNHTWNDLTKYCRAVKLQNKQNDFVQNGISSISECPCWPVG